MEPLLLDGPLQVGGARLGAVVAQDDVGAVHADPDLWAGHVGREVEHLSHRVRPGVSQRSTASIATLTPRSAA